MKKMAAAQWSHMNWLRSLLGLAGVLFSFKSPDTYYMRRWRHEGAKGIRSPILLVFNFLFLATTPVPIAAQNDLRGNCFLEVILARLFCVVLALGGRIRLWAI